MPLPPKSLLWVLFWESRYSIPLGHSKKMIPSASKLRVLVLDSDLEILKNFAIRKRDTSDFRGSSKLATEIAISFLFDNNRQT